MDCVFLRTLRRDGGTRSIGERKNTPLQDFEAYYHEAKDS